MILLGTLVNVGTVLLGGTIGVVFNSKMPQRIIKTVFQTIGLFNIYLGIQMALRSQNILIMVFSLILGAAVGEWIDIDSRISKFGESIKKKTKSKQETFTEGLVSAFLLFCMGSMTIIGSFEEGAQAKSDLLISKAVMDSFGALALASALGVGVIFSVIPLFIYQGGLTLLSFFIGSFMPQMVIDEMSAVGGIMLVGLGISILDIKKIKIINLLPALLFAILFAYIWKIHM